MAPIQTDAQAPRLRTPTTKLTLPAGTGAATGTQAAPAPGNDGPQNVPAGTGAKSAIGLEAMGMGGAPGGLATAGPPDPKEFADLVTREYGLVDANLKTPDRPEELVPSYPPVSTPPAPEPKPVPKPEECPPEKKAEGLKFRSWGDPHEVSGDGLKFDNQLVGDFIAMKSKSGDFMLQKRHENVKGQSDGVTFNTEASLQTNGDVIHFDSQSNKLTVNGKPTSLRNGETMKLPGGGTLTRNGDNYTIKTAQGDTFTFIDQGQYMDIEGELSPSRKDGEVIGSLGRFDADTDASNDLVMPDGTQAKDLDAFLEAWRVPFGQRMIPGVAPGDTSVAGAALGFKANKIMDEALSRSREEEKKRQAEAKAEAARSADRARAAQPNPNAPSPAAPGTTAPGTAAPGTPAPGPALAAAATPAPAAPTPTATPLATPAVR